MLCFINNFATCQMTISIDETGVQIERLTG